MAVARTSGLIRAAIVLVALSAVTLFCAVATAKAAVPPAYLSSFGPDGSESSKFAKTGSVAVDQQTHAVYVLDVSDESLYRFDTDGLPLPFAGSAPYISDGKISGLVFRVGGNENQVAVNSASHDFYVTSNNAIRAFQADGEPSLFSAGPGEGTSEITGFTSLMGVAVDASGDIYASDNGPGGSGVITVYAPSGEEITQFEIANPANLAVDANGAVYVNRLNSTVAKVTPSEFPVTAATSYAVAPAPFSPKESYSVSVDPATNDVYIAQADFTLASQIVWYDEDGNLIASFAGPGEEGHFDYSLGLGIDVLSGRLFVSRNEAGEISRVAIFGPAPICEEAPQIGSTSASDVTASSASLHARINPCSAPTTYRFEYGLSDCASSVCSSIPLEGQSIGSGHDPISVAQTLSDLQPDTTYHYRVVAKNSFGVSPGPGRTFVTQGAGVSSRLSDSRAWEMVSPSDKHGGDIVASGFGIVQASASGDALAYLSRGSIETQPEGNRAFELSSILANRGDGGKWASKDLTPPHTEASVLETSPEYKLFSEDLSAALLEPRDSTPLSPDASETTPYMRESSQPPAFIPLVNTGNVPAGIKWGGASGKVLRVLIAGANPAFTQVALKSDAPLGENHAVGSLYLWEEGNLQPISELPSTEGGKVVTGILGSSDSSSRHAISDDGSRVFWSQYLALNPSALYLRNTDAGESVRLDVVQSGLGGGQEKPDFQAASADGSVVFFTDSQNLTANASPNGADLYRCEIGDVGGGSMGCTNIVDISAPLEGSGEDGNVRGIVSAVSDDGMAAYFVAEGILDTKVSGSGDFAVSGEPNLYLWREGEGVRFITTLSGGDSSDWGESDSGGFGNHVGKLTSAGSPSGNYFAFMSQRSLTGYENTNTSNDEENEEVFVYDALGEDLHCVSCRPSGAAAIGVQMPPGNPDDASPSWVDNAQQWSDRWVAATLPESMRRSIAGATLYQPRRVFDSGRVFFNAVDPLVPVDSNGNWDVYQFEPLGIGDCSALPKNASVARSGWGCVGLLSSGTAVGESAFVDASASGDDVFFTTRGRLSALDLDDAVDVYDARVDGIEQKPPLITECAGENCQPASTPPNDPTPASEAFVGPGNLKPSGKKCPKGKRKVHKKGKTRCVPKHRKAKKSQAKAPHGREAS